MSDESNTVTPGAVEGKREGKVSKIERDARILLLSAQGVKGKDIAILTDTPESTVSNVIKRFKPVFKQLDRVEDFELVKSNILSSMQLAALESAMNPQKLAKSSFLASVKGAAELQRMQRLERNQSTENISHKVYGQLDMTSTTPDKPSE